MLSLLVSGGHTQLVLSKSGCNMKLLVRHWTMQSVRLSTKWLECSAFPILEVGDFKTSRRRKSQRKEYLRGHLKELENFQVLRSRVPPRPDHSKSSNSSYAQIILPAPCFIVKILTFLFWTENSGAISHTQSGKETF